MVECMTVKAWGRTFSVVPRKNGSIAELTPDETPPLTVGQARYLRQSAIELKYLRDTPRSKRAW